MKTQGEFRRPVWDRRAGQRGFTLIELLVVIAVLAILAVVVLFNVTGVKNKGQAASCSTDIGTVQTAVDAYIGDNGPNGIDTALGMSAATVKVSIVSAPATNPQTFTAGFAGLVIPQYLHINSTACATMFVAYAKGTTNASGFTVSQT